MIGKSPHASGVVAIHDGRPGQREHGVQSPSVETAVSPLALGDAPQPRVPDASSPGLVISEASTLRPLTLPKPAAGAFETKIGDVSAAEHAAASVAAEAAVVLSKLSELPQQYDTGERPGDVLSAVAYFVNKLLGVHDLDAWTGKLTNDQADMLREHCNDLRGIRASTEAEARAKETLLAQINNILKSGSAPP